MCNRVNQNNQKNIANNLVMSNIFIDTHRLTTPTALIRLIKKGKRRTKQEQR